MKFTKGYFGLVVLVTSIFLLYVLHNRPSRFRPSDGPSIALTISANVTPSLGWWTASGAARPSPATKSDEKMQSSQATIDLDLHSDSSKTLPVSHPHRSSPKTSRSTPRDSSSQAQTKQSTVTSAPTEEVWRPQPIVWKLVNETATLALPLPRLGDYQCKDQICSEFVTDSIKTAMLKECTKKNASLVPRCHFIDGAGRRPVALVSYPGSGNTWVRGLLEKATGICTGESDCFPIIIMQVYAIIICTSLLCL